MVTDGERGCIECGPLLHDLRKIQPNLSFPKVLLEKAIASVIKKMNWKLSKEHTDSMKRVVARRIRNCCHAVTQAEKKTPHAKRLERLPWRSGEKKSEGDVPSPKAREVNSATATIEFVYGFDEERLLAYRHKEGEEKYSCPIEIDQTAEADELLFASWDDGSSNIIDTCTVGRYRAMQFRVKNIVPAQWTGQHVISKHTLEIKQRIDRNMMKLALTEQGKPIVFLRHSWIRSGVYLSQ